MKPHLLGLLLLCLPASGLLAQTVSNGDPFGNGGLDAPSPSPAPSTAKAAASPATSGSTVIDSEAMDYDEKTRIAVFTGENYGVHLKDPSFIVFCDKLTAHMRKAPGAAAPGAKTSPTPTPTPAPKGKASAADSASSQASGLQSAIAEGPPDYPVVIVQDKPPANPGEQPQHNVGIAAKADYNADTGDVKLTGWPRVSEGVNTQIATSERTYMIMNKDGHTMKTYGPSRTVITEQDQPKKTGTNSVSQDSSASPTPQ